MVNSHISERCRKFIQENEEIVKVWEKGTDPFKRAVAATLREAAQGSEAQ